MIHAIRSRSDPPIRQRGGESLSLYLSLSGTLSLSISLCLALCLSVPPCLSVCVCLSLFLSFSLPPTLLHSMPGSSLPPLFLRQQQLILPLPSKIQATQAAPPSLKEQDEAARILPAGTEVRLIGEEDTGEVEVPTPKSVFSILAAARRAPPRGGAVIWPPLAPPAVTTSRGTLRRGDQKQQPKASDGAGHLEARGMR